MQFAITVCLELFCISVSRPPPAFFVPPVSALQGVSPIHPNLHYYRPVTDKPKPQTLTTEVCIYGGTSAGVTAAVQLARLGRKVILLEPGAHLGGMTTGGLSYTDSGIKEVIGGMARDFYRQVRWTPQPHVAEQAFQERIRQAGVPVFFHRFLKTVEKAGARIVSLTTEDLLTVRARLFLDCTYEGDLMAKAGVHYRIGREPNSLFGETANGVRVTGADQFNIPVDPYVRPGDPSSGFLPGIEPALREKAGAGDDRIQAYNFRLCLTRNPQNRLPFPKPEGYDPQQYELLARYLAAGSGVLPLSLLPLGSDKVDANNKGPVSSDFVGMNYEYPDGDYATRERIFRTHVVYQQGLMWFLTNDPRAPPAIRQQMADWGLCRDEFTDTGGWPHQLYVREARRMISDYTVTEFQCRGKFVADDPIGMASYGMDSHICRRFVRQGRVYNEGEVVIPVPPFPISYRAIVPKKAECENLFVPVCLSASHIAYGAIRMEPVFMILSQSAALAADIALSKKVAVQDVSYVDLKPALEKAGQILALPK
jgi:hypothetical protein